MGNVSALEIASFLNSILIGKDIHINNVASLNSSKKSSFRFSKNNNLDIDIECLILVPQSYLEDKNSNYSVIKVNNPRLAFAKVLDRFFGKKNEIGIHPSTTIGTDCKIDSSVSIGSNCFIGNNVTIGKYTIINHNVTILDNTIMGDKCHIRSGSIIGEEGFGFDFEEDGTPVRIPHLGNVVIGENVEIGPGTIIDRGTLDSTIVDRNVKIDAQVFIAHNCHIQENTIIAACAEVSGSVTIGRNCWIAPNCSIIQKVMIGDNVTIGIGAIVTNDISSNKKIMGLESLELRPLIKVKKRIEYGK